MEKIKTKLFRYPSVIHENQNIAACLGNFDGIHLGHKALLEKICKFAKENKKFKTMLVSFYPHPALVLGKAKKLPSITSVRQMCKILSEINIDYFYLIHFTNDFSKITADEFIEDILIDKLKIKHIVVGEDARVGAEGKGDASFILEKFHNASLSAEVAKYIDLNHTRISSRLVREAVEAGDFKKAKQMTGRHFSLNGRVIEGQKAGRTIGFPTANLKVRKNCLIPKDGVYATRTVLEGEIYNSVSNIGFRPTLNGTARSIESYLLDYKGAEFYNAKIELEFVERIRDELKFSSIENLKAQIEKDVKNAKGLLTK